MLEENGHNFLRFWSWMHSKNAGWSETPTLFDPQPFARLGPGRANGGEPRFDLSVWNDAYFRRLPERVEQAGRRSVYCGEIAGRRRHALGAPFPGTAVLYLRRPGS